MKSMASGSYSNQTRVPGTMPKKLLTGAALTCRPVTTHPRSSLASLLRMIEKAHLPRPLCQRILQPSKASPKFLLKLTLRAEDTYIEYPGDGLALGLHEGRQSTPRKQHTIVLRFFCWLPNNRLRVLAKASPQVSSYPVSGSEGEGLEASSFTNRLGVHQWQLST